MPSTMCLNCRHVPYFGRILFAVPKGRNLQKIHCLTACLMPKVQWKSTSATDRGDDEESTRRRSRKYSSFIDSLRIFAKAGHGGQGLPNRGGAGGRGGDIIVVGSAKENMTLKEVITKCPSKRFTGGTGADSRFFSLYGQNAKPLEIPVPLGICLISEAGQRIGEINKQGEKVRIARGGTGGCAANGFSAEKGQAHNVVLDLKLIADVGFLGFPNAGKSTLLKALSNAKPKIASYPFTTVTPNVGLMEFPDFRRITLADLPGLIEGAHANQGMGHRFLKHVERTKLLLFIVDLHGFQLSPTFPIRTALETIVLLNKELELYQTDLTEKPAILALNKVDLPNSYNIIQQVRKTLEDNDSYKNFLDSLPDKFRPSHPMKFEQIVPISAAKDMSSVKNLQKIIRKQLDINEEYAQLMQANLRTN